MAKSRVIECCPKCHGSKLICIIDSKTSKGSLACAKCKFTVSGTISVLEMHAWNSAHFWQNVENCAEIAKTWPKWKRDCARGLISE